MGGETVGYCVAYEVWSGGISQNYANGKNGKVLIQTCNLRMKKNKQVHMVFNNDGSTITYQNW